MDMNNAKMFICLKNSEKQMSLLKDLMLVFEKFYGNALAFQKSKKFATIDQLTKLYNKSYFFGILRNLTMKDVWPMAVLMLDLDDFKMFNDTHGHQKGDILLRNIGLAINNALEPGHIACRYGGEEFCILIPNAKLKHAISFANNLRGNISKMNTTISIGLALFKSRKRPYIMVTEADRCLYEAKRSGKNKVVMSEFE